ncbi:hypothetical protein C8J56DRAFT_1167374 [Mycena floridula]|nr:hypothetical protein C8J56DRAFT_1167374 [Mycena floridula]
MKLISFSTLISLAILAQTGLSISVPRSNATADAAQSSTCTILGSGVRYRTCPNTSSTSTCKALGEYAKGTKVSFTCWEFGENVQGNNKWDITSSGHFVSDFYVSDPCPNSLPQCIEV